MNVREAKIEDIPRLIALNEIVHRIHVEAMPEKFRGDASDEEMINVFRDRIEQENSYFAVAENEAVFGFLDAEFRQIEESWCLKPRQVCYLRGIVVESESRQQGVGRRLFESLKNEAELRGITEIELDVFAFNNDAKAAFESFGFEPVAHRMRLGRES